MHTIARTGSELEAASRLIADDGGVSTASLHASDTARGRQFVARAEKIGTYVMRVE